MKYLLGLAILVCSILEGSDQSKSWAARVHAHLLIQDFASACQEAQAALAREPENTLLWETYIEALARAGDQKKMMAAWRKYAQLFPEAFQNRTLIEKMAWGVIEEGSRSHAPIIRIHALLGAFYGQDAKGVQILRKHLDDKNLVVRLVAVQLAGKMRDAVLAEKMLELLKQETNGELRLQVIQAIGSMKIPAKEELIAILTEVRTSSEEKAAAIQSLVSLMDSLSHQELVQLASSERAGLRELACEAISHFDLQEEAPLLLPLLNDTSHTVRIAALQCLGKLRIKNISNKNIEDLLYNFLKQDPGCHFQVNAGWVLMLMNAAAGKETIARWLYDRNPEHRIYAAAALSAAGKYGTDLMLTTMRAHTDPYVQANLAMGLIGQNIAVEECCQTLYSCFLLDKGRWMWQDFGCFHALAPNKVRYEEAGLQTPDTVNQLVRLEILNLIAMMKYEKAKEAIALFLHQKSWGVCGAASALLLTECDESALELVSAMLDSPIHTIRVQAALIIALWARDERAIKILQDAYVGTDRELKEKILEGLGHIGSPESFAFLVDKLDEPYQTLRIIAASALLECLYH